jgi:hypothetical protein
MTGRATDLGAAKLAATGNCNDWKGSRPWRRPGAAATGRAEEAEGWRSTAGQNHTWSARWHEYACASGTWKGGRVRKALAGEPWLRRRWLAGKGESCAGQLRRARLALACGSGEEERCEERMLWIKERISLHFKSPTTGKDGT